MPMYQTQRHAHDWRRICAGLLALSSSLRYGLAGAMLLDLGLHGRLACERRSLAVADRMRTGDVLLDEVLSIMRRARRRYDSAGGSAWYRPRATRGDKA
jgi:hypothetical protein